MIGPNKEALGIVSTQDALHKAREYGLDLVEIAPKANPPVCKIIDYSKLIFEESKKAREAKKKQHVAVPEYLPPLLPLNFIPKRLIKQMLLIN